MYYLNTSDDEIVLVWLRHCKKIIRILFSNPNVLLYYDNFFFFLIIKILIYSIIVCCNVYKSESTLNVFIKNKITSCRVIFCSFNLYNL